MTHQDIENKPNSTFYTVRKWISRLILSLVLSIIILIAFLHLSSVQTYILSFITDKISQQTNTTVKAERIKFSIFDGIALKNLLILDNVSNDTILHGGQMNLSLRKNIFTIINNKLDLSYIGFKDIKLNIITEEGEYQSNLALFLSHFSNSDASDTKSQSLDLGLNDIDLSNIDILINDKNLGKWQRIYFKSGSIKINNMNLPCNEFDIESIVLDEPIFHQHIYDENCKITDNLLIEPNNGSHPKGQPFLGRINEFAVSNGRLGFSDSQISKLKGIKNSLDYNNFFFEDIKIYIKNFNIDEDFNIFAQVETLQAKDDTGFKINNFAVDTLLMNKENIELKSFTLSLGTTHIRDYLILSFEDWSAFKNFGHDVYINAHLNNTQILLGDIAHFVPALYKFNFVNHNYNEVINIDGKYAGFINNLGGRNVKISLGDKMSLTGIFNTRDLLDANNTLLNVRLDRFSTSMRSIKKIFPKFNPPPNFYKLGKVNFFGRFDGFLENFVAYGTLNSDLGSAKMDMKLDIMEGTEKSKYSGNIELNNFNLKKWSDNKDLGFASFSAKVSEGFGLTLNTVKANLKANVSALTFKGYKYRNIDLNGRFNKNTFDGFLSSDDENFDFVFDGNFEYFPEQSFLNFDADIKKIDLKALNWVSDSTIISGTIKTNVAGSNLNDFIGDIQLSNLYCFYKDSTYTLENLSLASKIKTNGEKEFLFISDIGEASIVGQYDLTNLIPSLDRVIYSNHQDIYKLFKSTIVTKGGNQRFDFNLNLGYSKNFLSLLGLKNSYFSKMQLKGRIDTYKNDLSLAADFPSLSINNQYFKSLILLVNTNKGLGDIFVSVDSTFSLGRSFNPIDFQAKFKSDTLSFDLATTQLIDSLENLDIAGELTPHSKGYKLSLSDKNLTMLGKKWTIQKSNSIIFGKEFVNISNFNISDGDRVIEIDDTNKNKGISVGLSNFDLSLVNSFVKINQLKFNGLASIAVNVPDIFSKEKNVVGYINVPQFTINQEFYGSIFIDAELVDNKNIKLNASIGDFIALKGDYDLEKKELDSKVRLRKAPMMIIQYFLADAIKNTEGYLNGDLFVKSSDLGLTMKGEGTISKGKTTVVYTGVTYSFDKQKFSITEKIIDLTGTEIKDKNGNIATINGVLSHSFFRNFGVNATISGNNIVALNTTKKDNPDYYGYCVGEITANFNGLFERLNMNITGITKTGTKLFIPVEDTQKAVNQSFIKFVSKDRIQKNNLGENSLKGINLEMSLTITPEAEMSIIFDEARGDIIKGKGRGNIKIEINRNGDFEMFGNYDIETGEYLFTAPLLLVAKPFVVERGGRVQWTGDPVNATLDITAKYRTRTSSLRTFIAEYLVDFDSTDPQLRENVDVEVELKLGGYLFSPEISFGLKFPNLIGESANLVENKLRLLQNNNQELNSQVLGLIVFNSFIPSTDVGGVFGASGIQSASINTLSEFLASQLSLYITNVLNTIVSDESFISSIDFGLNVRNNRLGNENLGFIPDEVGIRNTIYFKNNRLSIDLGGQFVYQYLGTPINQVLPDFALEFVLTEDRKLRIRLYGKADIDLINFDLRQKYGLGIGYRTEFGSMLDFEETLKRSVKEAIINK